MCFVCVDDVEWEELEWGELAFVVGKDNVPDGEQLCVLDVKLKQGQGHNFHRHPNQEEMIFVRSGTIEQWVLEERKILTAGDVCFIPKGNTHATFVASDAVEAARLLVVLGPSFGESGYDTEDMSTAAPWATLRT
jgi:quercetin dioxygenase-like cupin family protein